MPPVIGSSISTRPTTNRPDTAYLRRPYLHLAAAYDCTPFRVKQRNGEMVPSPSHESGGCRRRRARFRTRRNGRHNFDRPDHCRMQAALVLKRANRIEPVLEGIAGIQ